jgi:hypothetical protein
MLDISDNRGKFFIDSVPWFPRKLTDLDSFAEKVLEMGEELSEYFFFLEIHFSIFVNILT